MTGQGTVRAVLAPSPFRKERLILDLPPGGSVADMLLAVGLQPEIPARIFIGDQIVLPDDRSKTIPRAGEIVIIRATPGDPVSLAAIIALTTSVAAAAAGPGAAAGLGLVTAAGALTTTGAIVSGVVTAGVGLVGSLITKALIPPPSAPKAAGFTAPATFTISGQSNQLAPYAPLPRVYGTRKAFPILAGQAFTEIVGNDQYIRMLLTCGYGPLDMTQLKIAQSLLTIFQDVQWEQRCGYPDDTPLQLYSNDVAEQQLDVLLLDTADHNTIPTGWQTQTSGVNADEISVDITHPQGLQTINNVGNRRKLFVTWQCRFAPHGTTSWVYVGLNPDGTAYTSSDSSTSITDSAVTGSIVRRTARWTVAQGQYDVQTQVSSITWLPNRDTQDTFFGQTFWTALRTIRHIDPVNLVGLSKIALRIRASNQLNGTISQLSCLATSILRDYDSAASSWETRAGSWEYGYDTANAGGIYGLDTLTPHTAGGRALQIKTKGASDSAGVASRPIPVLGWASTLVNISAWYKASKAISSGVTLRVAFGADDNFQTGTWPDWQAAHAYHVGDTITPTTNNPGPFVSGLGYIAKGYTYRCVRAGTSAGSAPDFNQGISSLTEDGADPGLVWLNIGGPTLMQQDIAANIAATTSWQQVTGSIKIPYNTVVPWQAGTTYFAGDVVVYSDGNKYVALLENVAEIPPDQPSFWQPLPKDIITSANFMRVIVYNAAAGAGVTISWDDLLAKIQPADVNILPNPSFDTPGSMTSNPATHYRDVLQGSANKRAVDDSRVDLAALQLWHVYADANGYLFNGIFDKPGTVFDTLRAIAAVGRGSFFMRDSLYSALLDQTHNSPVQHFTPRNSWGFRGSRPFPDLPHAVRVRFVNSLKDYQTDEIVAYDDGYNADGSNGLAAATKFELLDESLGVAAQVIDSSAPAAPGSQPWKDGRYHLAQGRLRPETYQLHADIESIVCQRGDLVYVTHDVPQWGRGAGRVKQVLFDGSGNATGIITDETFIGDDSSPCVVRIRRQDGTSVLAQVGVVPAAGSQALTFSTPLASLQPEVGDLVLFGFVNSESVQLLVTAIEPQQDLSALIYLQDYAPAVYLAEQAAQQAFTSALSNPASASAPNVAAVRSDESVMVRDSDGSLN